MPGAIPATDLAGDHRGAECLFRAPVSGVDLWVEKKREDAGEFARKVRGEPLDGRDATARVNELIEAVPQPSARHSNAVRGNDPGVTTIAHVQGVREHGRHLAGKRRARVFELHRPTPP